MDLKCSKCGIKINSKIEFEKHVKEQHGMSGPQLQGRGQLIWAEPKDDSTNQEK